jgi:hypothetical protein
MKKFAGTRHSLAHHFAKPIIELVGEELFPAIPVASEKVESGK